MANPILRSEILEEGLVQEIDRLNTSITTLMKNLEGLRGATVQEATAMTQQVTAAQNDSEALAVLNTRITMLEEALKKERDVTAKLTEEHRQLAEVKRRYRKLTDEERASVMSLASSYDALFADMKKGESVTAQQVQEIEVEKKSYNELNAIYNTLKDTLNKMTVEQRNNTEVGKAMTAQAMRVRDTMNELQKATGNYTLQVGKYRAAFDGLGYSFQQILREAPSALNIQQFFLAISNNIPMFLDQVKAFNAEQKEIKDNLAQMTQGTKEYAEQQAKQMTIGKKLIQTALSWQTLVLVGLMLLRKLPDIINKIKTAWGNGFSSLQKFIQKTIDSLRVLSDAFKAISLDGAKLDYIQNRLNGINKGTQEWIAAVKEVNRITNANIDPLNTTKEKLLEIIDTYKKLQYQMNINNEVFKKVAADDIRRVERDALLGIGSLGGVRAYLGDDSLKDVDENKVDYLLQGIAADEKRIDDAQKQLAKGLKTKAELKKEAEQIKNLSNTTSSVSEIMLELEDKQFKEYSELPNRISLLRRRQQQKIDQINKEAGSEIIPSVMSDERRQNLLDMVKLVNNPFDSGSSSSKTKSPSLEEWNDRYWEMEEAKIAAMEEGYDKEIALEIERNNKALEQNEIAWDEQVTALDENLRNGLITREEYATRIEESKQHHDAIEQAMEIEHQKKMDEIFKTYQLKRDEEIMASLKKRTDEEVKQVKRRVRTVNDEKRRNNEIVNNIKAYRDEIDKLTASMETMGEDGAKEAQKRIKELNKAINKDLQQVSHTKQLSRGGSLVDMFIGNIGDGKKQSMMERILGKDAYSMFEPDSEELKKKVDEDIEAWAKYAEQTAKTWYSTTMGYINDIMNAYVELANKKAEAAADATQAAQEEYDKEKALLEAGYASRVEATWAEYQERKAAQEQAEKDAEKAAEAQRKVAEVETYVNLVQASAAIWKSFAAWPPVAIAMLATMWGSFAIAKAKAAQVSKYGDGGFEMLEGGSHASGHDIALGTTDRHGRSMHAEGGEGIGIFCRKAIRRYGSGNIETVVDSINNGTFEANAIKRMGIEQGVGMRIVAMQRTDLHKVENGISKLVDYGSRSNYVAPDGTIIEQRKSGTVRYRRCV